VAVEVPKLDPIAKSDLPVKSAALADTTLAARSTPGALPSVNEQIANLPTANPTTNAAALQPSPSQPSGSPSQSLVTPLPPRTSSPITSVPITAAPTTSAALSSVVVTWRLRLAP
jgi:hypothetical protein